MAFSKIKSFFKEPNCSICGGRVKGWARRQCDNCGALVCASHRPPLVPYWECPACKARQGEFLGAPEVGSQLAGPRPFQPTPDLTQFGYTHASDSRLDTILRTAESLYAEGRDSEADALTGPLLSVLYRGGQA